jgi:hypothetical protein
MPKRALLKMADAVRRDLQLAIANYEIFAPSARDAQLHDRINRVPSPGGGHAFNVISEALQITTIAALCRIWDKRKDAAHIPNIATRLSRNPALVNDQAVFKKWLAEVEGMQVWEPLVSLRGFRNVGQSHTSDPNLPDPRSLQRPRGRRVVHGDERKVLEATMTIVGDLDRMLGVRRDPAEANELSRTVWRKRANGFWNAVGM